MKITLKLTPMKALLNLLIALGTASVAFAQGETGTATLSGVFNAGLYDYTITLNNTSTTPIGTFWYAWVPGGFFLPSTPASVTAPPGGRPPSFKVTPFNTKPVLVTRWEEDRHWIFSLPVPTPLPPWPETFPAVPLPETRLEPLIFTVAPPLRMPATNLLCSPCPNPPRWVCCWLAFSGWLWPVVGEVCKNQPSPHKGESELL